MWKDAKVRAFSLLEALVALLVISGGLLLFQSMSQLLGSELRYQTQQEERDWLLFADQLEMELAASRFQKVENNRIYLEQKTGTKALGLSSQGDFRKTNAAGQGYQPMIFGIQSAQIQEEAGLLRIRLTFKQGLEREFVYRVAKKS